VRNTFIMLEEEAPIGQRRPGEQIRQSSLPPSFKLSVPSLILADASSEASTDVPDFGSLEDSPQLRPRRNTAAAALAGYDIKVARQAALQLAACAGELTPSVAIPQADEICCQCSSDGLRTPSTVGSRSPMTSPRSPTRRVSFALSPDVVHVGASQEEEEKEKVTTAFRQRARTSESSGPHAGSVYWRTCVAPTAALATQPCCSTVAPTQAAATPANVTPPPGLWTSLSPGAPARSAGAVSSPANAACIAEPQRPSASAREAAPVAAARTQEATQEPVDNLASVVEYLQASLIAVDGIVVCAEAVLGGRGWTVTAYVQPEALKVYRSQLFEHAQQALLQGAQASGGVYVLGYASSPFSPMPLGFGAALAEMQDAETACWNSFAHGFCDSPGVCQREHPRRRVGVHVVLKPARARSLRA